MLPTIPVFIEVRPFQVSHLCFEVGGILRKSFVELGTSVQAFDFDGFYTFLRQDFQNDGRLAPDSNAIDKAAGSGTIFAPDHRPALLATLRAESLRAALDKAINVRHNAFITKYGPKAVAAVTSVMREIIPLRGQSINRLSKLSDGMTRVLDTAYTKNGRTGAATTAESDSGTVINIVEFRAPSFENLARNERTQISLGQEAITFNTETHYLDRLEDVFANELASIDADVNRLQVAYLNTILMSPFEGTVTGVYKNPGDSVSAGEPVFRVENDAIVLIVANVVCRGPVLIGSILSITTTLFDGAGSLVNISATIVAARGQGDDDQWEVIGKVSNIDAAGNKIFPLGYRFGVDKDITQVSILAPNEI
jgi:hypothetical protein